MSTADPLPNTNYFPLLTFIALAFFTSFGIWNVVWMMISEVFPSKLVNIFQFKWQLFSTITFHCRSREIIGGIATFGECMLTFAASKIYLDLEAALTMPGSMFFYAFVSALG